MGKYEVAGKDIPEENKMFVDIWGFRKEFYKAVNEDVYFDTCRKAADKIYEKYPTDMCREMLWAVMNDLERRAGIVRKERGK